MSQCVLHLSVGGHRACVASKAFVCGVLWTGCILWQLLEHQPSSYGFALYSMSLLPSVYHKSTRVPSTLCAQNKLRVIELECRTSSSRDGFLNSHTVPMLPRLRRECRTKFAKAVGIPVFEFRVDCCT